MNEELLKELDNDSLNELLLELESLDQECERLIKNGGAYDE